MLQFVLGLSDRQAAEAVRCRIDFKYATAMELDDPGFHHSVLADFRDCLTEGDRADRLLGLALARLEAAGLVRERTRQCTDSTHVLAAVRDLARPEMVTEAVRAALEEVAGTVPHLLDELVDKDRGRRYGRPVRLGKNPAKSRTSVLTTGNDALRLPSTLLKGRIQRLVFVTHRRPGPGKIVSPRDVRPDTGLARLSYGQARALPDEHTALRGSGTGWDLHEYRHSALTHLGEQGTSLLMLMAKSGTRKPENVRRCFKPSPEAIAELTSLLAPGNGRR
ncbi:transposase [Streptomyces glaucus]|uniref:transposase n=1 Tax=Streptomyces glaucus TaxID=284029 RepID=UPI0031D8A385